MKMESKSLLQLFAIDKHNVVRSVDEVLRGLACECTCPNCGEKVIARQGDVREWHFAHSTVVECDFAAESALHRAAKQVLLQNKGISLPIRKVIETLTLPDGRTGVGEASRPEMWIDFITVDAEMTFSNVRPDITASIGSTYLFIEIAVTHFVDENKMHSLNVLNIPTIEIDLSKIKDVKWTWPLLEVAVLENPENKKWLKALDFSTLQKEAKDAAIVNALSYPVSEVTNSKSTSAVRTRFWIDSRMLDIIERPFGLAIWSPYDPHLNDIIKPLMRTIGGRWQPRFKNWLAPLEAKPYLFDELYKLSNNKHQIM